MFVCCLGLSEPLPTYVGVFSSATLSYYSRVLTHLLLSYVTGDKTNITTKDECVQHSKDSLVCI